MTGQHVERIGAAFIVTKTIRARFDGEVLRPEDPVDFETDTTYLVTIELDDRDLGNDETYPLTAIAALAVDMGVTDLSENRNCYVARECFGGYRDIARQF